MLTLRGTQQEFVDKGITVLKSKSTKKCVMVAPVAYGKSIAIANIVLGLDAPALVLQPNKELLEQNFKKYTGYGYSASICSKSLKQYQKNNIPYTVIDGTSYRCNEISNVTFATPGSIKAEQTIDEIKEIGVKYLIIDECFPFETPIVTDKGSLQIGDIHNKLKEGQIINVKSYNEITEVFEFRKVIASKNNGVKDIIKIYYGRKLNFECTLNHKILTLDGWKEAINLKAGDAIICSNKKWNNKNDVLTNDQFDVVIGSSLGDGSLDYRAENSSTARLRITQGIKQRDFLEWKAYMLNSLTKVAYVKENGYSKTEAVRVSSKTFYFKEEYKNYEFQITKLNLKSLAVLWMDDGSLAKKQNAGSLYSLCHSKDLVTKLNSKLRCLGITGTQVRVTKSSSTGRECFYIGFRKESVELISKLCAKYIHQNLIYKVVDKFKNEVGTYIWDNKVTKSISLFKKSKLVGRKEVFDIEVEDNHNFIISTQNAYRKTRSKVLNNNFKNTEQEGVVVHNCHLNTKGNSVIRDFIGKAKIKNVLGVTATPIVLANSFDGALLRIISSSRNNLFSTLSHVVQIQEMIDNGYWSPLVYDIKHFNRRGLKFNTTGADYTPESIKVNYDENNLDAKCIRSIKELRKEGRKSIIVFVPSVNNAIELSEKVEGSAVVHGNLDIKERSNIIEQFKNKEIDVVINVEILTTGFDHPELDAIVMARPTASVALYYQIIGRITRIHDDKPNGRIVDLSGNVCKFGKIESLNYEYIEGYGWGLFTKDRLLTNHPLQANDKPTKEILTKAATAKGAKEVKDHGDVVIWFGKKYKNQKIKHIDKHYLTWMLEKFDFNSTKMKSLKNSIEIVLNLK
jgi:DNA repair protein RadD